jgi:hypothetical protein
MQAFEHKSFHYHRHIWIYKKEALSTDPTFHLEPLRLIWSVKLPRTRNRSIGEAAIHECGRTNGNHNARRMEKQGSTSPVQTATVYTQQTEQIEWGTTLQV